MSHTKTARNARIVRLRDKGMSFAEIVRRLAIEFPEDAIKAERVRNIYYRDKFGTEEPGTLFRRRQREGVME